MKFCTKRKKHRIHGYNPYIGADFLELLTGFEPVTSSLPRMQESPSYLRKRDAVTVLVTVLTAF